MKLSRHVTRWIHSCSNCTKGRRSVDPRLLCMVCILHSVLELRSSHNWCVRIIYCACWCIYTHCSESHEMPIYITHSFRVDRWSGLYCIVSFICNVSVTGQRPIVSCNGWGTGYVFFLSCCVMGYVTEDTTSAAGNWTPDRKCATIHYRISCKTNQNI